MTRLVERERPAGLEPRVAGSTGGLEPDRAYWERSADCLFVLRVEGHDHFIFEGVNPATERLCGLLNVAVAGRRVEDVVDPATASAVLARYRQCVRHGMPISYFETLTLPFGRRRWRTKLTPVQDDLGRVVRLLGSARAAAGGAELLTAEPDVSLLDFEKILDLAPNYGAIVNADCEIIFVNKIWRDCGEHTGLPEKPVGENYISLFCDTTDGAEENLAKLIHSATLGRSEPFSETCRFADRHFIRRLTPVVLQGAPFVIVAHEDVTEVVKAQQALAAATERLLAVQEEERERIGRELHDSTSQHLVVIGLGLAALRRGRAAAELVDEMSHALDEANREIRTLTYLLHPPALTEEGMEAALRRFVDGFGKRCGILIALRLDVELSNLPLDVAKALFRIVQEALANVHRHASAKSVSVRIRSLGSGLRLMIVDDGASGERRGRAQETGVGIHGMEARLRQFGGDLTVTHRAFGTIVRGFIPRRALTPSP
jgi:signal transduction histidine kinase